jgi:hypothetical protein
MVGKLKGEKEEKRERGRGRGVRCLDVLGMVQGGGLKEGVKSPKGGQVSRRRVSVGESLNVVGGVRSVGSGEKGGEEKCIVQGSLGGG